MHLFNTTLNRKSNTLLNPILFGARTMLDMHATMTRLYQAAEDMRGWRGQSEVARYLNQSPQTLANWEKRGMSKGGILIAQEKIGCSAVWLETGQGPMQIGEAFDYSGEADLLAIWAYLLPSEKQAMLDEMRPMAAKNREAAQHFGAEKVVSVRKTEFSFLNGPVSTRKKKDAS
jgi:hypothetical protein